MTDIPVSSNSAAVDFFKAEQVELSYRREPRPSPPPFEAACDYIRGVFDFA
jgi:hypothetical protein